jgi:3-hydroxyisobutyrate dehydrogenase-like beta-hydroxyacid dehydrogenase
MSNSQRVAILGVGKMGAAMAKELAAAGVPLNLWNRNAAAANDAKAANASADILVAASAGEALRDADFAICTFTDGKVTQAVLIDDATTLASVKSTLVIADMGTSGVSSARALNQVLSERGIAFVDAPVSGSVATIAAHQLLVMASGKPEAIDALRPTFAHFAKKVAVLGEAGAGQAMKLAVNLVVHSLSAAVSEALALSTAAGIAPEAAYDVFEESVVAAPFVKYKRAAFLDAQTPVAMRIDTVGKDMGLILGLARELNVPMEAAEGVRDLYLHAQNGGFEASDMAAVFRFLRES